MKSIHKISQNLLSNFSVWAGQPYAPNKPIYIFLEVTNRCNLACIMCGRTHDPRYKMPGHCGDLTLERVKRLDSIFPFATFSIPTGVGEPFINLELVPILKYLKSKGTQVSLTSNGTLLTSRHALEVIRCGLDKIVFSVDGATKRTFEKIRVHSKFDVVINNIKRLQDLKKEHNSPFPVIEFELVAMTDNFPELPMWAELAGELGIQGLIVQNLFGHSGAPYEEILRAQSLKNIPYSRGTEIWEQFLQTARTCGLYVNSPFLGCDFRTHFGSDNLPGFERPLGVAAFCLDNNGNGKGHSDNNGHGNGNGNGHRYAHDNGHTTGDSHLIMAEELLRGELEASASVDNRQTELVQLDSEPSGSAESCLQPMYCTQPWSVIYMSWNGDIRTCCFNDYALGNIDRNTIDEIWNGPRYRAMRKSVAEGKILEVCRDCVNGKSNYSVIPKLDPSLLFQEIRAILHQALT